MRHFITFLLLLTFSSIRGQSSLTITVDSSDANYSLLITKDEIQHKMLVAVQQLRTGTIDTLYDNLNVDHEPSKLIFAKIVEDKYCILLIENRYSFIYRHYECLNDRWQFQHGEILVWKRREFTTTVEVLDYKNIKMRNGSGDYIFRIDLANRKMVKEKVETDKH